MSRTIPPTIISALASPGAQPSYQISSLDLMPRLSQLNAPGSALRTKAIISSAGTIIRAVVSQGADPNTVTIQRITDPTQQSQWAAAGSVIASNAQALAGCGLVQTGSTIRCFYASTTSNHIVYRDSTNDGVSWGAEQTGITQDPTVNTCTGIAPRSTTDLLFASYAFANAASLIYRSTFSGSWSAIASVGPPSPAWGAVRGLDCDSSKSPSVIVAGVKLKAYTCGLSLAVTTFDGTTWAPWTQIAAMDTGDNGLSYQNPAVHYYSGDANYYVCGIRHDDGSISGSPANYPVLYKSADTLTWQPAQSIPGLQNEAHAVTINGILYAFDATGVFNAPATPAASDLSADLLGVAIHETSDASTKFTFRLGNKDGKYNSLANLRDNAQVSLSLGYNGSTILTHVCYIDALEYVCLPDSSELRVYGRDLTKFLDQISHRLILLSAKTVAQLVQTVCTLAGVALAALPGTSQFSQTVPCFQISPGESWYQALLRLGAIYDFEQTITYASGSPQIKITERSAGDAAGWSYGQEALGIAWQRSADQPNWVRVVGGSATTTNVFADAYDTANALSAGAIRYRHIVDRMCDTSAKCQIKANLALRDDQTQSQTGALSVLLNPQLEVLDVISLTDPRLGLSAQPARINTIQTTADFEHGAFLQHLTLELP